MTDQNKTPEIKPEYVRQAAGLFTDRHSTADTLFEQYQAGELPIEALGDTLERIASALATRDAEHAADRDKAVAEARREALAECLTEAELIWEAHWEDARECSEEGDKEKEREAMLRYQGAIRIWERIHDKIQKPQPQTKKVTDAVDSN